MNTFTDLVQVYATSSGTGPFAMGAAVPSFDGVNALLNGHNYSYSVQQGSNFEVGTGTFVGGSNILQRTQIVKSSSGGGPVAFDVNAQVVITFTAEDIADLVANNTNVGATAKAAFNAYGLQWATWFNATPAASELLALYTSPISYEYLPNFAGAYSGAPAAHPTAPFVMTMEQQLAGTGGWTAVGTITVGADGGVALATGGASVVSVGVGDRLRVLAPTVVDAQIAGFAVTFKGYIP